MSGYHLSNIFKETGIKHGSRPPEGKSKAIVAATAIKTKVKHAPMHKTQRKTCN